MEDFFAMQEFDQSDEDYFEDEYESIDLEAEQWIHENRLRKMEMMLNRYFIVL